jgi:hypothetical protein
MAVQVILRKGNAAQNNAFTGVQGEVTVDTTNNTLRVHDGTTPGGTTTVMVAAGSGNVTSTGNLVASANVVGNNFIASGIVSAVGNITGNYILGNGALLTGVSTTSSNINNGTSNVTVVSSGGNITIGVGGTSNIAVFSTTGVNVTGVIQQNNVPTTTRATAMSLIYGG